MLELLNFKSRNDDNAHGDAVDFGGPTQVFSSIYCISVEISDKIILLICVRDGDQHRSPKI